MTEKREQERQDLQGGKPSDGTLAAAPADQEGADKKGQGQAEQGLKTLAVHGSAPRFHQEMDKRSSEAGLGRSTEGVADAASEGRAPSPEEGADSSEEVQAYSPEQTAAAAGAEPLSGASPDAPEAADTPDVPVAPETPEEAAAKGAQPPEERAEKSEEKPEKKDAPRNTRFKRGKRRSRRESPAPGEEGPGLERAHLCARLLHRVLGKRMLLNISAALLVFQGLVILLLNSAWRLIPHQGLFAQSSFSAYLISRVLLYVLAFSLPLVLLTRLYPLSPEAYWGRRRFDGLTLGLTLLMGFPAALCFSSVNNLLNVLVLSLNLKLPSQGLPHSYLAQQLSAYPPLFIVAVLCPAILDELFFRGFLGRSLNAINSRFLRRLLQGLCYAVFFCDPLYLAAPFLLGLLLSKIQDLGHGLALPIVLHFGFACSQLFLSGAIPQFSLEDILSIPLEGYHKPITMGILALLSGLLLIFLYRFLRERLSEEGKLAGLHGGQRARLYGRNRYSEEAHQWSEKDRHYTALLIGEPPRLNWRFGLALAVWLLCLIIR